MLRHALAGLVLWFSSAAAATEPDTVLAGVWRNPRDSVRVEIGPCGTGVCGVVVWASEKAQADAREGGTARLVGTNLLRDFVQTRANTWRGKVFVPDLRRTVSGTIVFTAPDTIRARSCAFEMFCRTQIWTRVG